MGQRRSYTCKMSNARRSGLLRVLVLAAGLLLSSGAGASGEGLRPADAVLVVKSERRLYLLRGGQPFRSYRVALGLLPDGQKEREGDRHTPEGHYLLDLRKPDSEFFLAIRVSYPNADDLARARHRRWKPGGSIMIHGLPNVPKHTVDYYRSADWTDGCIALTNDDMLEVWLLTRPNTPIEIRP
jgi:murein L,D-transpeptidase YafK